MARCNKMVERLVKTLKHGIVILFTKPEHAQDYDKQFPIILFGYMCRIYAITKFSPHILMISQPPPLKVDNFLSPPVEAFKDDGKPIALGT
jgi:hypothetical protein